MNDAVKLKSGRAVWLILLSLWMSLLPTAVFAYTVRDSSIKKKLDCLLEQYSIPGAVLSYKLGNKPVVTIATGNASIEPERAMTADSLFLVGSVSKSYTAALILQLMQAGKVQLNDTLDDIANRYQGQLLPLVLQYPSLKPMTIKQLLNHTSGVPQSINTELFKQKFSKDPKQYFTPAELLAIAMTHSVYFKPGAKGKWSYTNTDYVLLGMAIEDISGQSLPQNFKNLFASLSLNNTYYAANGVLASQAVEQLASGYLDTATTSAMAAAFKHEKTVLIPPHQVKAYQLTNAYNIFSPAASGVVATAPQLVSWYTDLFTGKVVSSNALKKMLTVVHNGKYNAAGYGLGVSVHDYPGVGEVVSHDGLEPGYSVIVMYFVKPQLVLAIATNSSSDKVSTFNVHTGEMIPGVVTQLLPDILRQEN